MTVTNIKQQVKNPERVSIFVDGTYACSLTLDQLLEYKLKKGAEIEGAELEQLKKASEEGKLKTKALDWLLLRPHSTRELREYGYRKKIEKDLIESWIVEFQAKNYLNDETFAQWFVENRVRKNKSHRAIAAELAAKGIDREVADRTLQEASNDSAALSALVAKLRSRPRYQDEQKLLAYLAQKGFGYDQIKAALHKEE